MSTTSGWDRTVSRQWTTSGELDPGGTDLRFGAVTRCRGTWGMDDEFAEVAGPIEEDDDGRERYTAATDVDQTLPEHILPEPEASDKYRIFGRSAPLDEEELEGNYNGEWYPTRRVFDALVNVYDDMVELGEEYGRTYEADGALALTNDDKTVPVIRPENAETLIACGYEPEYSKFSVSSEDEQVTIWLGYYPDEGGEEGAFKAGATLNEVSLDELTAVRDVLWDRIGKPYAEGSR